MHILLQPTTFEWDAGNINKNLQRHKVYDKECEEVFFDEHKKIIQDTVHSHIEIRYILIGKTSAKRLLFVVFTIRQEKVRVISARGLNKREKHLYENSS